MAHEMSKKFLLAVATGWGPRHGGINSFNYDFLRGFAAALLDTKVVCLVPDMTVEEYDDAKSHGIDLRSLPFKTGEEELQATSASAILEHTCPDVIGNELVCIGHDVFTGALANELARLLNARSAVIHHMSYETYKGYQSGSSEAAQKKTKVQKTIFGAADIRLAIGPLLRDELIDWFGEQNCYMLIPGLPEIEPMPVPLKWTTILFGRLNPETNRVKQTKLAVAGAARCEHAARKDLGLAKKLKDGTRIKIYGGEPGSDTEIREFIEQQIGAVMDVHVLPYTENRSDLFDELRRSSLALMPSWHEGFGLVGWEAIAAGVPVIMGKDSGLYRFLQEFYPGTGTGCVTALDVRGSQSEPHYQEEDVDDLVRAIKSLASEEPIAKRKALALRELLSMHTPRQCALEFAKYVGWADTTPTESPELPAVQKTVVSAAHYNLLEVPAPTWDPMRGLSYSQLLRAEEACVPYVQEASGQLEQLLTWTQSHEYPLALRLYIGPGGTGKTRLLIEACRQMLGKKWVTGFLTSDIKPAELRDRLPRQNAIGNWLIVIDYAETRREQVATILEWASGMPNIKLRLVLLARDIGEWWERFPTNYPKLEHMFSGPATSPPQAIKPLHPTSHDRRMAYESAIRAYAAKLNVLDVEKYLSAMPNLAADHFARPLYLQMAALLALHGERADSPNGLTDAILRHEYRYWSGIAKAEQAPNAAGIIADLMTIATLAGGIRTEKEAWEFIQSSDRLAPNKVEFARVFRAICPLYPGRQGLQPLRPDLLGEALVASNLTRPGSEALLHKVLAGATPQCEHALTVLTRSARLRLGLIEQFREAMAKSFHKIWRQVIKVGRETGTPLPEIACDAFVALEASTRAQVAQPVLNELESSSLQWDALAVLASDTRVENANNKLRTTLGKKRDAARRDLARALKNRSLAKSYYGDYQGSLTDARRAMEELELCPCDSDSDIAEYATTLKNVSNRARRLKDFDEAIAYAERALDTLSKIKNKKDDPFATELASVLISLAGTHISLERYEDALQNSSQAIEILRKIASKNPNKHLSASGTLLLNHSRALGQLGYSDEAMKTSLEATEVYKPLALARPDRYTVDYAHALLNLSDSYDFAGKIDAAVECAQSAVDFLKPIAMQRPMAFSAEYAFTLHSLGNYQRQTGQYAKAHQNVGLATTILSNSDRTFLELYRGILIGALSERAWIFADEGRYHEAIPAYAEAEGQLDRENKLTPSAWANRKAEITIGKTFLEWLRGAVIDIEMLQEEVYKVLADTNPRRRAIRECELSFLLGCHSAINNPGSAIQHFNNMLDRISGLNQSDQLSLLSYSAIASNFVSVLQPDGTILQFSKDIWQRFADRSGTAIPRWVPDTFRALGLLMPT